MKRQAPAGRRIPGGVFSPSDRSAGARWSPLPARYFDSGTSALAIALRETRELQGEGANEALLPAYACPNLVAAAGHAGLRPGFIDFVDGGSTPSSQALISAADNGVVVAVDFCGVPSFGGLPATPAPGLVHDLAQSYAPFLDSWVPRARRTVVSFGRAKPLSLTLGGAILGDVAASPATGSTGDASRIRRRAAVYNLSLNPWVFGVLARLPFLGIGMTVYRPHDSVRPINGDFPALAAAAVVALRRELTRVNAGTRRALQFAAELRLTLPFELARLPAELPLWRVPVLLEDDAQAGRFATLGASFGVSRLYQQTLPEFLGVSSAEARERWPHAWQLSRRLVTIPSHGRLSESDWRTLGNLLPKGERR